MERDFSFYREEDGRWFVDLPEWDGDISELEMVCGADLLLEALGHGEPWVKVKISTEPFEDAKKLEYVGDGFYSNDAWHGPSSLWLCHVTQFVFGDYPKTLYYR